MMKVNLWISNEEVKFDESKIFECDEYEQNVLVNGIWIAFDEVIGEWVRVGTEEQYWQEHTEHYQY